MKQEHPTDRRVRCATRCVAGVALLGVLGFIVLLKIWFAQSIAASPVLVVYGTLVGLYLGTRMLFALVYRPIAALPPDDDRLPTVRVVIPVMNEADGIVPTVAAILASEYPADRLTVHVIDDGSTDNTWCVANEGFGANDRVMLTRFTHNQGKRAGMAAGIRAAEDVACIVFVDSDSIVAPHAIAALVTPLVDGSRNDKVGGTAGHAEVSNLRHGALARMQQVRYWAAFRIVKAAESGTGAITCASGCFSAWRRHVLVDILDTWESQTFLGAPATFGDDRALTNYVLRNGWDIVYQSTAECVTEVPATMRRFCTQQMRWKRSWTRESVHLMRFIWRRTPRASLPAYASIMFQLVGPIVVMWSLVVHPLMSDADPTVYLIGLYAMALVYALVYATVRGEREWSSGMLFVLLYSSVLVWQTYLAMLTCRRTGWGTRALPVPRSTVPVRRRLRVRLPLWAALEDSARTDAIAMTLVDGE